MNRRRFQHPLLTAANLFSMVALSFTSCGPKGEPLYPVTGQVFYKGKPTPGALVVFQPVSKDFQKDPKAARPSGYVQEDGSFTLSTRTLNDGAPEGEYKVVIIWTDPDASVEQSDFIPNKLPPRYADAAHSGLTAKVEKGANNQPVFHLK